VRPPPAQQQGQAPPASGEGGEEGGAEQLRALFRTPQFANVLNLLRQNPSALQPLLAQLSQSAPAIYNVPHHQLS
jgi:hypothetical protein